MKAAIQNSQKQHMDMQVWEIMQEHKQNSLRVPFAERRCLNYMENMVTNLKMISSSLQIYSTTAYYGFDKRDDEVKRNQV